MKRKAFFRKGILGVSTILGLHLLSTACEEGANIPSNPNCPNTPSEIKGPFPNKTPADLVRENIIRDRTGVALLINFTIQNTQDDCNPLPGATVDLWQCDAKGNYSQYDEQLDGDFANVSFLRGRQTTDINGRVSFISIYPGWYPGRAPHLHLEIKSASGRSLLVSQVAFPEDVSNAVYQSSSYGGTFDTANEDDQSFNDSLEQNLPDSLTGNINDGYIYEKVIKVSS
ncbi:MAG: intradiol ring-cleavage dioxygenase [Bacteroidota bacterium]